MLLLTSLFPDLVLLVPGCPEPTMERALRDAARQFCRDTYAITQTADPITTVIDEPLVELADVADSQKEIVAVLETIVNGTAVTSMPRDLLRNSVPSYMSTDSGRPCVTYLEGEARLKLWPTPDDEYEIVFVVATAPTATATQVDDDLGLRWKEALLAKASSILTMQQGVSYTNTELAAYGLRQYAAGVGKARVELNRSYGRGTRVSYRGHLWP